MYQIVLSWYASGRPQARVSRLYRSRREAHAAARKLRDSFPRSKGNRRKVRVVNLMKVTTGTH